MSHMKSDIFVIAANFFVIGIFVGAQWYLNWWGLIAISSVLFVTWQAWQRLSEEFSRS